MHKSTETEHQPTSTGVIPYIYDAPTKKER